MLTILMETVLLKNKLFDIVYADPPWDYQGQTQHAGTKSSDTGSATRHYATMTARDLAKLELLEVCRPDCLLFMWTTNPHLDQAIRLLGDWGFAYATVAFVWDKVKLNPGFYTMSQVELCLVGKRGKIPTPRGSRNERQLVTEVRGEHSVKPESVRQRINAMFPELNKLEIFARRPVAGWSVWGNEVESDVTIPWRNLSER